MHSTFAAAMLIAVAVAGLTTPSSQAKLLAVFCEGAGFAYANIISIIIVATIFTDGIKANGLIEHLTNALFYHPVAAKIASLILPFTLAGVTGSGSASAITVMNVLVPVAPKMNLNAVDIGALAAVVIMSATISRQAPLNLIKLCHVTSVG